jgi:hypothetical protein
MFLGLPGLNPFAAAQGVQTGELAGNVTSSDGQPLPGVTVSLVSPSLQGVRTTQTSPNGDYLFKHLPLGAYRVSFELSGFSKVERQEAVALGVEELSLRGLGDHDLRRRLGCRDDSALVGEVARCPGADHRGRELGVGGAGEQMVGAVE